LAVLLSGPLLWYATSSFGEMLAALVTTALVAACLRRAGAALVGLLLVLAGLSKDTALPFLLLLGLGSSLLNPGWAERGFRRRLVAAGLVGLGAAPPDALAARHRSAAGRGLRAAGRAAGAQPARSHVAVLGLRRGARGGQPPAVRRPLQALALLHDLRHGRR